MPIDLSLFAQIIKLYEATLLRDPPSSNCLQTFSTWWIDLQFRKVIFFFEKIWVILSKAVVNNSVTFLRQPHTWLLLDLFVLRVDLIYFLSYFWFFYLCIVLFKVGSIFFLFFNIGKHFLIIFVHLNFFVYIHLKLVLFLWPTLFNQLFEAVQPFIYVLVVIWL